MPIVWWVLENSYTVHCEVFIERYNKNILTPLHYHIFKVSMYALFECPSYPPVPAFPTCMRCHHIFIWTGHFRALFRFMPLNNHLHSIMCPTMRICNKRFYNVFLIILIILRTNICKF